jgi:hypothetical protein
MKVLWITLEFFPAFSGNGTASQSFVRGISSRDFDLRDQFSYNKDMMYLLFVEETRMKLREFLNGFLQGKSTS